MTGFFLFLTLLSCKPMTPADGPQKGIPVTSCSETFSQYYVRSELVVSFTQRFHSYPTLEGWKLNQEYCRISFISGRDLDSVQTCAELVKQFGKKGLKN